MSFTFRGKTTFTDRYLILHKAEQLEEEAARLDAKAEAVLKPHRRMALAMTLIQIAITLCFITVLTRRRWLFAAALTAALANLSRRYLVEGDKSLTSLTQER